MISKSGLESCKTFAEIIAELIPGGVGFGFIEGDTITWVKKSESFSTDLFHVGYKITNDSTTMKSIRENKVLTQNVPRSVYGTRLKITSIPVVDDIGKPIGALSIAMPRLHPIASSFKLAAPVLVEMFPEGSFLFVTDLEKIMERQPSTKFDMTTLPIGYPLTEKELSAIVIKTRQPILKEVDSSKFGIPIYVAIFPLFDDDDIDEVVGTFGIITPKKTEITLREMASNLQNSLTGVAAAIEELAASASQIHTNEQSLNNDIKDVINISEQINEVSAFIKEIADETKMLGLNAAIEAARAGDSGRGFGVVAEEIRKLSDQSKSTVPKIKKLTDDIRHKVDSAREKSQDSLGSSQEQAAATEEITASIEEITSMSEELLKLSKEI
jgi:hypothetical protein